MPAMITVNTNELPYQRPAIDLVCLIDISGSMEDDKFELIKQTLNIIYEFLNENDRICLIKFNDKA